jgi:hypothetical protein
MFSVLRHISFLILAGSVFLSGCEGGVGLHTENQENVADSASFADSALSSLPDVLQGLPLGIEVWHEPDTLMAVKWEKDTTRYVWKHQTYMFAYVSDLKIIEFGTYNYKHGKWELGNINKKLYGPDELGMWYVQFDKGLVKWEHPEDGLVKKDVVYFDPSNYSIKNKELVHRRGLWYFIGVDSTGKKYAGYGRYVALPELY